jgi:hypothetical protein
LVKSAKLVCEPNGGGLALVEGAEPSWWERGDILAGFPKPEQVQAWWEGEEDPPDRKHPVTPVRPTRRPRSTVIQGRTATGSPPVAAPKRPVTPLRMRLAVMMTGRMITATGTPPVVKTPPASGKTPQRMSRPG